MVSYSEFESYPLSDLNYQLPSTELFKNGTNSMGLKWLFLCIKINLKNYRIANLCPTGTVETVTMLFRTKYSRMDQVKFVEDSL